jgi:hypothetical protein
MAHGDHDMFTPQLFAGAFRPDGSIDPGGVTALLRITKSELAEAIGVAAQAITKTRRAASPATQTRLRDIIEIVAHVTPWSGSAASAFAWYRSQPIPSFGDVTAEELVRQGRAADVKRYLNRIAEGGYA